MKGGAIATCGAGEGGGHRRGPVKPAVICAAILLAVSALDASAQDPEHELEQEREHELAQEPEQERAQAPEHEGARASEHEGARASRPWWSLYSTASDRDRVLWGMWTLHVHHLDEGWSNDKAITAIYRGVYAGTFRTTHGPRAYSIGLERSWLSTRRSTLSAMLGFRTGLVYGYDGRLGWLAEKYPILPFAQPMLYAEVGPVTTDFTYTWVVMSLSAGLRF